MIRLAIPLTLLPSAKEGEIMTITKVSMMEIYLCGDYAAGLSYGRKHHVAAKLLLLVRGINHGGK